MNDPPRPSSSSPPPRPPSSDATGPPTARDGGRPVVWDWSSALRGAVYGLPAGAVALSDVRAGAVLAIGVIPAAVIPLAPTRARRRATLVFGVLTAASLLTGALVAQVEWLAVAWIFAGGVIAGHLAARRADGVIALTLCLPLVAVGLSYPGWSPAGRLALVLVAGSLYAWLVSLAWPPWPAPLGDRTSLPDREVMLRYGFGVGAAGALCAAIGFALDLDHVGWAAGAALLVMRPSSRLQRDRSIARLLDVVLGALVAIACLEAGLPPVLLAVLITAATTAATATATSRWYLTPGFTTFLVFLLLVAGRTETASGRFWERVGETFLGVAVAFFAEAIVRRRADHRTTNRAGEQR